MCAQPNDTENRIGYPSSNRGWVCYVPSHTNIFSFLVMVGNQPRKMTTEFKTVQKLMRDHFISLHKSSWQFIDNNEKELEESHDHMQQWSFTVMHQLQQFGFYTLLTSSSVLMNSLIFNFFSFSYFVVCWYCSYENLLTSKILFEARTFF